MKKLLLIISAILLIIISHIAGICLGVTLTQDIKVQSLRNLLMEDMMNKAFVIVNCKQIYGGWPKSLNDSNLDSMFAKKGAAKSLGKDVWENSIQYTISDNNEYAILTSLGRDGKKGGWLLDADLDLMFNEINIYFTWKYYFESHGQLIDSSQNNVGK